MLDTNIVSDMMADQAGIAARRLFELGDPRTAISVIVAGEILFAARRVGSLRIRQRFQQLLASVEVLPMPVESSQPYSRIRADLQRRGQLIGANDMLIAAHAMALGATLVTDNADFSRVDGLTIENWLRD